MQSRAGVHAATNRFGSQLRIMGAVKGRDQLQDLLRKVGINLILFSEPLTNTFRQIARSPKQIAEAIEKSFQTADELELKILSEDTLTAAEQSFRAPMSLIVGSSSVRTDEGLARIQAWFDAKKV
jgi:hypothetical protein